MDYVYSASTNESIASFLPEPANKIEHIKERMYKTEYPNLLPAVYNWPGEQKDSSKKVPKHSKFEY